MSRILLPDRIELDGVVELLRCPDYQNGWSADEIKVSYSPDSWHLPNGLGYLREEWDRLHPNERSDPKVALREIQINQDHTLVCRLQATAWREVRPLHVWPRFEENALVQHQTGGYKMLLPNIGVVHVVASTRDGWILAFRRSSIVHYHPGTWSATYEEGLAPDDISTNQVFQRTALRGFTEEVSSQACIVPLEAFHVVSVVLERPLGNPAVVVRADLPISLAELPAHRPSDELDTTSLVSIPIDQIHLRDILSSPIFKFASHVGKWHPTSRYRLLVAIAHFFGEDAAADALSRVVG